MKRPRIIPILLLDQGELYKTNKFNNQKYIGDPLNAVKIFNEKQCDELIVLDFTVSKLKGKINFNLIEEMASECFMPVAYGGGIKAIQDIQSLLKSGIEKVILNSAALDNPEFIKQAVNEFGGSTIVVSVDVSKNIFGQYKVKSHNKSNVPIDDPFVWLRKIEDSGVGEAMVNVIDLDGTQSGYDIPFYKKLTQQFQIPIIAAGGCAGLLDMKNLLQQTQTSAAAAGSMFVFHGKHRAVLIHYPEPHEIESINQND